MGGALDRQVGLQPVGWGFSIMGGVMVLWAGLWIGRWDYGLVGGDLA